MVDFRKKYSEFECELNVSVCTTGAWPTSSIQPVKKPPDIVEVSDRFTQFYLNRFSGRRLNFQMDKGKGCECSIQQQMQEDFGCFDLSDACAVAV